MLNDYIRQFRGLYRRKKLSSLGLPEGGEVVGETVDGREILMYRFGEGGKMKILFLGGIFGDEVLSIRLMFEFVKFMNGRERFLGVDVFVLPCLDLDGLARYLEGESVGREILWAEEVLTGVIEQMDIVYCFTGEGGVVGGNDEDLVKDFAKKSGYRYVDHEKLLEEIYEWCDGKKFVQIGGGKWEEQRDSIISALKYHYG